MLLPYLSLLSLLFLVPRCAFVLWVTFSVSPNCAFVSCNDDGVGRTDSQERASTPTQQELSPVAERPTSASSTTLGVVRSRTLPSRRDQGGTNEDGSNSLADDEGRRARVLRKQKRLSMQPKREGAE